MTPQNEPYNTNATPRPRYRSVALPAEHGGWGFLLEPVLLGLLAAPSLPGALLGVAALFGFLLHQPQKIAIKDRLKGRRYTRTRLAERFALAYALLAVLAFAAATALAGPAFWLVLAPALPLILIQVYYDMRSESRQLLPEIAGALALGASAPAVAIIGGWGLAAALLLWLYLGLRVITSILYVRARLRLERGRDTQVWPVIVAHIAALLLAGVFVGVGLAGWPLLIPFGVLLIRAGLGLSRYRRPVPAKVIGFRELAYGILTAVLIAVAVV